MGHEYIYILKLPYATLVYIAYITRQVMHDIFLTANQNSVSNVCSCEA